MTTSLRFLHWTPRIICILAILFVSIFALDAFDPALTMLQQLAGFLIHMIPSLILTGLLILAWKKEFIGGLIILMIGIVFTPIIYIMNYRMNNSVGMSLGIILTITFPFILTGILFIIESQVKRRNKQNQQI